MIELEKGTIDLLSYQQTMGGSIFRSEKVTQDLDIDYDNEHPLERTNGVEIRIPPLEEIEVPHDEAPQLAE